MNNTISGNRKATIDTITLIQREYFLLQKRGEEEQIMDFLSRLESKANVRTVLLQEGKSRISSPIPEASSPDYWHAVLILIKHARLTFLEDKDSFLLFLSKFKTHLSKSKDREPEEIKTEIIQSVESKPLQREPGDIKIEGPKFIEAVRPKVFPSRILKSGKISVLGLDRAGKTTLIQRIKNGTFNSNPAQTIGVNTETIEINNEEYTIWDLGGEALFRRALWEMYTKNSAGLVFVIDIVNQQRFPEALTSLKRVLSMSHLANVPLAVFFNKNDLLVNLPNQNLLSLLGISKIRGRESEMFQTSAKTGEGIREGLDWLSNIIMKNV
ncbi:MAG: ADP-ribosylation factor family protein [Candidatus Hodarchaeales archaeon]|jgi:small GTP-binding protein